MTWSLSINAASKAEAKLAVTMQLPTAMLQQKPHARDFDVVRNAINGAIDACNEGVIGVTASGHVNTDWAEPVPSITGVNLTLSVYSTAS